MPPSPRPTFYIGQEMPDGTLYAGVSPTKGTPMYILPHDASLKLTFDAAVAYPKKLQTAGKKDFRLPDIEELKVISANTQSSRRLRQAFNTSGDFPAGYYWSSTEITGMHAKALRLSDGYVELDHKSQKYSAHFIR